MGLYASGADPHLSALARHAKATMYPARLFAAEEDDNVGDLGRGSDFAAGRGLFDPVLELLRRRVPPIQKRVDQ